MPDTMDLLTISVEAGLGFDAALAQVVKNVPGPLSEEIARMLQEMQIGVSRAEAFRHLNDRTEVPELDGFVLSMIQADKYGVGVAKVLRAQATELRQKRRQRAEEVAQKVPLKLLFPTIFLVLPAMFIVILGPGAIKAYQTLFGVGPWDVPSERCSGSLAWVVTPSRSAPRCLILVAAYGFPSASGGSSLPAAREGRAPVRARLRGRCVRAQGAEGVPPRSTKRSSPPGSTRLATAARTFELRSQRRRPVTKSTTSLIETT